MKFKKYLKESINEMSVDMALKTLDISKEDAADKGKLKSAYRKYAIKYHPDRGGSEAKMKEVNDAYETLSNSKELEFQSKKDRWERNDEKYRQAGSQIKTSLLSNFKPEIYQAYFREMSGFDFQFKILRTYPSEKERSPSSAGFDAEFFTKDRSAVFTMKVHANLLDIVWNKAELGYGDLQYNVYTEAHGFYMNKKQKMSQRDWKHTRDHSFFRKPEQLFPEKKMKDIFSGKTSKRAFKKRDMETFITKKLGGKLNSDFAYIPIGDGYDLVVYRNVFMRMPNWGVNGIYKKFSRISRGGIASFPETEDTALAFEMIQKEAMKKTDEKAKVKKVEDLIKYAYEAYKKTKGL